jgi:carbon monoxide dehydrogenase subunit G
MRFEDRTEIAAPRERVWAFLTDPRQVGPCGPGVTSVELIDDVRCRVRAQVGIGFIRAHFSVGMELVELEAPEQATIRAHGQAPGSAVDATATMRLSEGETPGTTVMDWSAEVTISGTLASVGSRMIEGTAHRMIDQTFACIKARLEA